METAYYTKNGHKPTVNVALHRSSIIDFMTVRSILKMEVDMLDMTLIDNIILTALREDMPSGDITTDNIVKEGSLSEGALIARQDAVIAGT